MKSIESIVKKSKIDLDEYLELLQIQFSNFKFHIQEFYNLDDNEFKKAELVSASLSLIKIHRYLLKIQFKALGSNYVFNNEEDKKGFCSFILDELFNENKIKLRSMQLVGSFVFNEEEPTFDEVYEYIDKVIKENGCGCKKGDK